MGNRVYSIKRNEKVLKKLEKINPKISKMICNKIEKYIIDNFDKYTTDDKDDFASEVSFIAYDILTDQLPAFEEYCENMNNLFTPYLDHVLEDYSDFYNAIERSKKYFLDELKEFGLKITKEKDSD